MKSTGITRQIDSAGRIVLPKELRTTLGLKENEDYLEIFTEGEYIMLRKYAPSCVFCGRLEELVDFVALSESTPGPLAVNMATFVGIRTGGVLGALVATFGIVLPSFIIILIIAKCFETYKNSQAVGGILSGLKPSVVGMIGAAFISVARTVFFPSGISVSVFSSASFCVFLGLFAVTAVLAFKKIHPIKIILLSAVVGIGVGYGLGL